MLDRTTDAIGLGQPAITRRTDTVSQHHDHQSRPGDPIEIIDVSPLHDHLPAKTGPSRVERAVAAARANVVRLVPGVTSLPLGVAAAA